MLSFTTFLLREIRSYKLLFTAFITSLIFSSISVLILGKLVALIIDRGISLESQQNLDETLNLFYLLVTILAISTPIRFWSITLLSEKIVSSLRTKIFAHIVYLKSEFFEDKQLGQLISNIASDLTLIQTSIASSLSIMLRNIVLFVGSISILFWLNYKLTFLIILFLPLLIIPIIYLVRRLKTLSKDSQERFGDITSFISERIIGIKIVQAYNKEKESIANLDLLNHSYLNISKKRIFFRSALTGVVIIIVFFSLGALIKYAASQVITGHISPGVLTSYLFYSLLSAFALTAITEVIGTLGRASAAVGRANEILQSKNHNKNLDPKHKINKVFPIRFSNISFKYPSRTDKNLDNINFTINEGEFVAIVGPSGAGKSTIFEILLKFYDHQSGQIFFGDTDIENINESLIRENFSLVLQDATLFSGSIIDNICLGLKPDMKKINKACIDAQAYEFINQLPQKMLTNIGERGMKISGGEKQRIAIARALYHNHKIILLDEVTSNLDSENEKNFQDIINDKLSNHTLIVITHRLATIKNADKIIVMDKGIIQDIGSHKDLLKGNELYQRLYKQKNI